MKKNEGIKLIQHEGASGQGRARQHGDAGEGMLVIVIALGKDVVNVLQV